MIGAALLGVALAGMVLAWLPVWLTLTLLATAAIVLSVMGLPDTATLWVALVVALYGFALALAVLAPGWLLGAWLRARRQARGGVTFPAQDRARLRPRTGARHPGPGAKEAAAP